MTTSPSSTAPSATASSPEVVETDPADLVPLGPEEDGSSVADEAPVEGRRKRRPAPSPSQQHWIYLVLCSAVLAMALLMSAQGEEDVFLPGLSRPLPAMCSAKRFLGLDCPGCGLTRCFISMAHAMARAPSAAALLVSGDSRGAQQALVESSHLIRRAWNFNPAGLLLFTLMTTQIPLRVWLLWRGRRGLPEVNWGRLAYWPLYVVAGALMLQWAVRLALGTFG